MKAGVAATSLDQAMLTNEQFERARRLGLQLAGIELCDRHRELLSHRSLRVGLHETALDTLLASAERGDPKAAQQLLSLLTTRHTEFNRHPRQFAIAAQNALEVAAKHGSVRLWSAAAATGEEPYSLAMSLITAFCPQSPPVSIVATDIDQDSVATAERGEYSEMALRALPPEQRRRFFMQCKNRNWRIDPSVRSIVEFHALNLTADIWPPIVSRVDVIFCRNVLMYLEEYSRYAVLERMSSVLAKDGLLILDPIESLGAGAHLFAPVLDGVFANRRSLPTRAVRRPSSDSGAKKNI